MDGEIVVVSGLPRSGTSLLMQMLKSGGLHILTDNIRTADIDNPRGYYEFEKAKSLKQDSSWLVQARGKGVKLVSMLLYELPPKERYRIIFVERDLDEILASQQKMLTRLGQDMGGDEDMRRFMSLHLAKLRDWLGQQHHIQVLTVCYNDLLANPIEEACRINHFLDETLDTEKMANVVDPSLYRNRTNA